MSIIKEFKDLPIDWKDQMLEKAQYTILSKKTRGSGYEDHQYPTPPCDIYLSLFIPEKIHNQFLAENAEYKETWEFALELCKGEWLQQMTRGITDKNYNHYAVYQQFNYNFGKTFESKEEVKGTPTPKKPEYSDEELEKLIEANSSGNADSK